MTSCQRKYREAPFQGGLVPRCKLDGQYEEVQCQGSTGECWCVDQDGKELPGNRTTEPVKCPILGWCLNEWCIFHVGLVVEFVLMKSFRILSNFNYLLKV